jgi:hypothetical protein
MSDDREKLTTHYDNYDNKAKGNFINKRFLYINHPTFFKKEELIEILDKNITVQLNKIAKLLKCYPLHVAIDYLESRLSFLSEEQRAKVKAQIATTEMRNLYAEDKLARLGLTSS